MIENITNINRLGTLAQRYLQQTVLPNFEPETYFYDMGTKPVSPDGYATVAWTRMNRMTYTPAQTLLQEGVTPVEKDISNDTIEATYQEYGMYVSLSTKFLKLSPIPVLANAVKQIRYNMARIVDAVIQTELITNGTYVLYPSTLTTRASITSTSYMTAALLAKGSAFLDSKAAPRIGGFYVSQIHPNVCYDLRTETNTGSFIDVNKYKMPEKIYTGEIGELQGVRIVKNPFIQTVIDGVGGTVTIYPSYIMGDGAYGVPTLQSMQTYMTPIDTATDSDPLAQRVKAGAKMLFTTKILQQRALVRIETASSLDAATFFFD